jgi:glycosyltransferase involved in cell wall biosynthesis
MAELDIILITYHEKLPEVSEVIRRIYQYTSTPFNLIIIDNRSSARMMKYLRSLQKKHANITLVRNPRNRYACYATNQGLRLCNSPFVFYLCSHECFIMDYGWEQDCIRFMNDNPGVGLAGHCVQSPVYSTGAKYLEQDWFRHFRNAELARDNPAREFRHVQGGFFVLRKRMLDEIGGFNEKIIHGAMDIEYSYYVESMGWEIGDIPSVYAIYKTTLPPIERYDPSIRVYHPLTLEKLKEFERDADRPVRRGTMISRMFRI